LLKELLKKEVERKIYQQSKYVYLRMYIFIYFKMVVSIKENISLEQRISVLRDYPFYRIIHIYPDSLIGTSS